MHEGYIEYYPMQAIKVDKTNVETYTEDDLCLLLQKPNMKKCSFIEYQSWVMTNFLFSTGVRQTLKNLQRRKEKFTLIIKNPAGSINLRDLFSIAVSLVIRFFALLELCLQFLYRGLQLAY